MTIHLWLARHSRAVSSHRQMELDGSKEKANLSEERVLEIRRRIADGFYELQTTVDAVAQRIFESGDLHL